MSRKRSQDPVSVPHIPRSHSCLTSMPGPLESMRLTSKLDSILLLYFLLIKGEVNIDQQKPMPMCLAAPLSSSRFS